MTHFASRYDQPTFDLLALAMAYSNNNHPQTLDVCAQRGDIAGVARLLALRACTRPHATKANNSEALRLAARNCHVDTFKRLLEPAHSTIPLRLLPWRIIEP